MIVKGYIFGIGYALLCLALSLVLYKLGLQKKYTRKVVHILVGFEWVILYHFMGAGLPFLSVCVLFLLILSIAYKGNLMPMISSDSDNAPGTVYYAAAMTGVAIIGCFLPGIMLPFGIGVMCTSIGDGFAGVVGQCIKRFNPTVYANKTLFGTLANVIFSSLSAFVISHVYSIELSIAACILIGIFSAELEIITPYGLDNVSVTWGTTALAFAFISFSEIGEYLVPIMITPLIIAFALSKKTLTRGGIILAIALDIAVTVAFGNKGFVILGLFFIGSILIDKIKNKHKNRGRDDIAEKNDCRDYMQVLANGLPAFVFSLAYIVTGYRVFTIAFVASMAEAFSDTAASGIGAFSVNTYDPFRRKSCEKGLSGGMSVIGTVASATGAFLIALVAYLLRMFGFGLRDMLLVFFAAFLGALFDSMLGSLLQAKYRCTVCGAITEKQSHCQCVTEKSSGFRIIDNDIVNLFSTTFAAVIAIFISILI